MKIKKNDNVIMLAGKDRGKTGKILRIDHKLERVVVEGINICKVHQRPRRNDQKGQIVERPMPVHVSNVSLIDSKSKKPTRVGYKIEGDKKIRISRKSGATI